MISFRHKSNTKQIKIKSKRDLNERMSPWLQGIFGIKNPIVGFKTANNKYYDTQSFYNSKQKFYGQLVDIIQAKDQLEISFVSDNLNSSSNIRQPTNPLFTEDFQEEPEELFKLVTDVKSMERRLQQNKELSILFSINQIYKNEISESVSLIKSQQPNKVFFYLRILQPKTAQFPHYSIYVGKKLVATLNLTREYKQNILMIIQRHSSKIFKGGEPEKDERQEERQQQFRVSYDQENQAPSFTTYQLQERLNQEACQDYLLKMYQQKVLKKYEYLKLKQKCEQNFIEFYRIFCEGAIDNDYENFKNQIRAKVDNNLELLLSNVDEMDLSRPISREQQRKQNLKKSVSNIEIVKVQNYLEILDQLEPLLLPLTFNLIKVQLIDQNQLVFSAFSDFLSRKISKEDLACFLQRAVEKKKQRPISRCLPRSANRNKDREVAYNSEDQIFSVTPSNQKQPYQEMKKKRKQSNKKDEEPSAQKQEAQQIKLMSLGSGSESKQQKIQKMDSKENKQTPPMFGSSKQQNNFSPIKYMSDIQSNYKQAWNRLQSKADFFEPEEFGLLYYYLESRDDSISNHIQQLQWNQQSSLEKLKNFLENKMIQIMEQNFAPHELDIIASNRNSQRIKCIYLNFKYQSDLVKFLEAMHAEVSILLSQSASPSPTLSHQLVPNKAQGLNKKSSDSNLLAKNKKQDRKYSDEQKQINSPKQSSCNDINIIVSHARTNELTGGVYLQILNSFWNDQFQEMLQQCSFTEQYKEQYLRDAFNQGNPSIYAWINAFVRGKYGVIDSSELRNSLKIREQENKYVMRVVPIFSQILKSFQEEGKISDKMRKWSVVELMELNMVIIGAFECYIKTKNSEQFVENVSLAYQLQNSEMEYFRSYLNRIQNILKQMSAHDNISIEVFHLYPKQIKAICQLYFITGDIDQLMDNLDCLHQVQRKRRCFKIATLNFSGINLNPFQYYDGSEDTQKISDYMKEILSTEQEVLDQKLFIIDKPFQNNLMSIRFGYKICQNKYLINRKEFSAKWRQFYDNEKPQSIKQVKDSTIEAMMLFDYYCYISVTRLLYGKGWKVSEEKDTEFKQTVKCYEIEGIEKFESRKLRQYLEAKLNRPASKVQKKYQLAMDYFLKKELDVFFLQEGNGVKWEEELVHQYGWTKGGASVILFRKDKFGAPKMNLYEKYRDRLNFNNDSAFYFGDRGYLLLSVHLKSNPEANIKQAEQMFKVLQQIIDEHPMLKIIIGADMNQFIGQCPSNFLNFIPKTAQQHTCSKMRTYVQVQFKKAGELSKMGKDCILTNLNIKEYRVEKINGELVDGSQMLPNDQHPYDHFVVFAGI